MSQNKLKYDSCFKHKQNTSNKSIFDYVTDTSYFVNKNECIDLTPTFSAYIPSGIPVENIDIENDLRCSTRINSKCDDDKFVPTFSNIFFNSNNKKEC